MLKLSNKLAKKRIVQRSLVLNKKFYTVKDLCEVFEVTPKTIYKWRTEGLKALIEKPLRFDLDEVVNWLKKDRDVRKINQ